MNTDLFIGTPPQSPGSGSEKRKRGGEEQGEEQDDSKKSKAQISTNIINSKGGFETFIEILSKKIKTDEMKQAFGNRLQKLNVYYGKRITQPNDYDEELLANELLMLEKDIQEYIDNISSKITLGPIPSDEGGGGGQYSSGFSTPIKGLSNSSGDGGGQPPNEVMEENNEEPENKWEEYIQQMLDGFKMVSAESNSEYLKIQEWDMFVTGIASRYIKYCEQITFEKMLEQQRVATSMSVEVPEETGFTTPRQANPYASRFELERKATVTKYKPDGTLEEEPAGYKEQIETRRESLGLGKRGGIMNNTPPGTPPSTPGSTSSQTTLSVDSSPSLYSITGSLPGSPYGAGYNNAFIPPPGSLDFSSLPPDNKFSFKRKVGGMSGGAGSSACDGGKILMYTDDRPNGDGDNIEHNININDQLTKAFIKASLVKTPEEFSHDFLSRFKSDMIDSILSSSYNPMIDYFSTIQENNNDINVQKINGFINTLRSNSVINDHEWNYYVSALKYIDEECNRLDDISIFLIGKPSMYKFLDNRGIPKWQLGTTDEEDADKYVYYNTSEGKFMTIGDGVFPYDLVLCEDNSISVSKLAVVLNDINTSDNIEYNESENTYVFKNDAINNLKESCIHLQTGPNLCDPSTTGAVFQTKFNRNYVDENYPVVFFQKNINYPNDGDYADINNNDELSPKTKERGKYLTLITHIQQEQDINNPNSVVARSFFIEAINKFMAMFGVTSGFVSIDDNNTYQSGNPDRPDKNINFIEILDKAGNVKYDGICFYLQPVIQGAQPIQVSICVGDTTINNISEFILYFKPHGGIPNNRPNEFPRDILATQWNSWARLYDFASAIYDRIPEETLEGIKKKMGQMGQIEESVFKSRLLEQIIISLKSFGDASQVDYVKKLSTYYKQKYGLNIYISSSDKNVGGESFLTDTPTWIVGLGTRPHKNLYKEKEFIYDITQFGEMAKTYQEGNKPNSDGQNVKCAQQLPDSPMNPKYNTMKAITTNSSLATPQMIQSDILTYAKVILSYEEGKIETKMNEESNSNNPEWINEVRQLQNSSKLTDAAKGKINSYIDSLNQNQDNKKILSELKCFLKKICDTLLFTEEEYRDIFTQKLKIIQNFIELKVSEQLSSIIRKYDLSTKQAAITKIITEAATYTNPIISDSTMNFAKKNLKDSELVFSNYFNQYQVVMANAVESMGGVISKFNAVIPPQPLPTGKVRGRPRAASLQSEEIRKQQMEEEIQIKIAERNKYKPEIDLEQKIADTQIKLKELEDKEKEYKKNIKRKLPKALLKDIQKKKENLEKFTANLTKIIQEKADEIRARFAPKPQIDKEKLRQEILVQLKSLKDKFTVAAVPNISSSSSSSASSSANDSNTIEQNEFINDVKNEINKASDFLENEVNKIQLPIEIPSTLEMSEEQLVAPESPPQATCSFGEISDLASAAIENIENIENNQNNRISVLDSISDMLTGMQEQWEQGFLQRMISSITQPITDFINSSSTPRGFKGGKITKKHYRKHYNTRKKNKKQYRKRTRYNMRKYNAKYSRKGYYN